LQGRAICEYTPDIAALIHELKENSQTEIVKSLGLAISRLVPKVCVALVPIPSKVKSYEARGYNPAKLLANSVVRQIAKSENRLIEVIDCLHISREVQDQASLSGGLRRTNLVGAMSLRFVPRLPVVWLVDDIVTTGSTIQEAARCLTEAGISVGGFLVFAETLPKNRQKAHAKSF
jgi:ComF family protein